MNGEKIKSKKILLIFGFSITFFIFLFIIGNSISHQFSLTNTKNYTDTNINSMSILFVGDMMLDREVSNIIDKKGFESYFAGVRNLINDADISIANLEGPFTKNPSITKNLKNKALQFTFDPSLVNSLTDLGFDILGLANNHTSNFGIEGLESTRRYIDSTSMLYYGDPNNKDEISIVKVKNGIRVGIIGFHEFSYMNFDKVFVEIEKLRPEVDILIVTPHWGIEYDKTPTEKQKKWAKEFIDSGADAVVGTHSHVIGDIEEYKGKKIFYSLGNFAFDQFFSRETMTGMGLCVEVKKEGDNIVNLNYKEITFEIDRDGVRVVNK